MHRQREAATTVVTRERPVAHGHARDARARFRLFVSEEAANRLGLSFGDTAAADSGQACIFAFLPRKLLRELHS